MSSVKNQKIRWASVIFLVSSALLGFVGAPLYAVAVGFSGFEWGLFIFYSAATMMAITAGYHRLYAHAAFKAHPVVHAVILFFGAASFEQSALRWASLHRTHHRYVDTERDPYNIKRGFFFAHMGWMITAKPAVDYDNAQDLRQNSLVMHQHGHYKLWAISAGLVLPLFLGLITGHLVGVFLLVVAARLALVHHATFFINSFAHTFGTSHYDADSTGKDNWLGALLTNGEGYHNYHHRFPADYRNGIRWYHWDPTKWMIWILSKIRLVGDLKKTSPAVIQAARQETRAKKASRAAARVF